jgi:dTDP-4-dehydrorhamnose 3,5-epimerase
MEFTATQIPDVIVIDPVVYEDARGFFMETWQEHKFRDAGIDAKFVQSNHSRSSRGTLRGLHYQVLQPQGKLIRVLHGEIYDVAVDLRKSSPTFGQWVGETVSAGNRKLIWIPPGFAHGFLTLSEYADFEYFLTDFYAPQHERTICWNDPDLAIDWPLATGLEPLLSDKDAAGVLLKDAEVYA